MQLKAIYGNALSIIFTSSPSELWLEKGEWGAFWGQGVGVEEFCGWIVGTFEEWQGVECELDFHTQTGAGTGCTLDWLHRRL